MAEEGGFDYSAYRRNLNGNPDRALLVTFEYRAEKKRDGTFDNVEFIKIWIDKNNEIVRKVTGEDKVRFADRYDAFKKGEDRPPEGTPISQCPFATPANVSACKAERIYTMEQIVEVPDERLQRAGLVPFKYLCRDALEATRRVGYVGELRAQIEARDKRIQSQEERIAALEQALREMPQQEEKRKPGRPPKVVNGDAD